jgi:hypothetical protein
MTKAADDVLDGSQALGKRRAESVRGRGVGLLDMFQLADMCGSANRCCCVRPQL